LAKARIPETCCQLFVTPKHALDMGTAFTPSSIGLFITNLRLLDLDLRSDWPGITAATFSTKDAQQNQKNRVRCAEWALYQLFTLWDVEEAKNVCALPHREFHFV
jgi:hypothetical protein